MDEVPDLDADGKTAAVSEEATGRSAVAWHEALHHAVQRWKITSKCSPGECVMENHNGDLVAEWRKRHARTRRLITDASRNHRALLGETSPPR